MVWLCCTCFEMCQIKNFVIFFEFRPQSCKFVPGFSGFWVVVYGSLQSIGKRNGPYMTKKCCEEKVGIYNPQHG